MDAKRLKKTGPQIVKINMALAGRLTGRPAGRAGGQAGGRAGGNPSGAMRPAGQTLVWVAANWIGCPTCCPQAKTL